MNTDTESGLRSRKSLLRQRFPAFWCARGRTLCTGCFFVCLLFCFNLPAAVPFDQKMRNNNFGCQQIGVFNMIDQL